MELDPKKPTLSQRDTLIYGMLKDENIKKHWTNSYTEWWEKIDKITFREYKYLQAMWLKNKYTKVNKFLEKIGLSRFNPNQSKDECPW
jgi:hypothetical protein